MLELEGRAVSSREGEGDGGRGTLECSLGGGLAIFVRSWFFCFLLWVNTLQTKSPLLGMHKADPELTINHIEQKLGYKRSKNRMCENNKHGKHALL